MMNTFKMHVIIVSLLQVTVSVLFVIEIAFLFFFHLYHGQWKLFLRRPYYLCLVVLAVGGLVAALPLRVRGFYDPLLPSSGLAIFQVINFVFGSENFYLSLPATLSCWSRL